MINRYNIKDVSDIELTDIRCLIANSILRESVDYKEGVVDLINLLKKLNFTLILATMSGRMQVELYSKENKNMREKMNILDMFDLIVTKDDVLNKKPHPEILYKIRNYYNASLGEILVFEDSYTGVLCCNNAFIVYDKYSDSDRDKIDSITTYRIKDYYEILKILEKDYCDSNSLKLV